MDAPPTRRTPIKRSPPKDSEEAEVYELTPSPARTHDGPVYELTPSPVRRLEPEARPGPDAGAGAGIPEEDVLFEQKEQKKPEAISKFSLALDVIQSAKDDDETS